jgi:hypothetical protein
LLAFLPFRILQPPQEPFVKKAGHRHSCRKFGPGEGNQPQSRSYWHGSGNAKGVRLHFPIIKPDPFCRSFNDKVFGGFLKRLGYQADDLHNLIILPTIQGKLLYNIRGAVHAGRHVKGYVKDIVEARLTKIMREHEGNIAKGLKADDIARDEIRAFQKELQAGLRDGSIRLQSNEIEILAAGGVISVGGLFVIAPPAIEFSQSVADQLSFLSAQHYTGNEGVFGYAGMVADLVNPFDDYKFACETVEQMAKPAGEMWDAALGVMAHNARIRRYGGVDDPAMQAYLRGDRGFGTLESDYKDPNSNIRANDDFGTGATLRGIDRFFDSLGRRFSGK